MDSIQYRLATPADVDQLVELRRAFLREVDGDDSDSDGLGGALRDYFLAAIPAGEYAGFVAVDAGEIVAVSGMVYHRYPPSGNNFAGLRGHILNIYTVPGWRKRGIASRLVGLLVDYAREHECQRVTLHAVPMARAIYERLGFVAVETEMRLEFS
jgi:GNAT superfamily N-acetyltransferase